jgi:hypothetical protein
VAAASSAGARRRRASQIDWPRSGRPALAGENLSPVSPATETRQWAPLVSGAAVGRRPLACVISGGAYEARRWVA